MDRKELYAAIKADEKLLADARKAAKGKGINWTSLSNDTLQQIVNKAKNTKTKAKPSKPAKQPLEIDEDCLKKVGKKANISSSSDNIVGAVVNVLKSLCITLNRKDLLNQLN